MYSTVLNNAHYYTKLINVFWAANQHIKISEDHVKITENRCWKYSFDHRNKLYFSIYVTLEHKTSHKCQFI